MEQIDRIDYMNTLIGLRDKKLIKVLIGVRHCGKSTVMQMFRDYLIADNVGEHVATPRLSVAVTGGSAIVVCDCLYL